MLKTMEGIHHQRRRIYFGDSCFLLQNKILLKTDNNNNSNNNNNNNNNNKKENILNMFAPFPMFRMLGLKEEPFSRFFGKFIEYIYSQRMSWHIGTHKVVIIQFIAQTQQELIIDRARSASKLVYLKYTLHENNAFQKQPLPTTSGFVRFVLAALL